MLLETPSYPGIAQYRAKQGRPGRSPGMDRIQCMVLCTLLADQLATNVHFLLGSPCSLISAPTSQTPSLKSLGEETFKTPRKPRVQACSTLPGAPQSPKT